jgi:hypothetical protein
VGYGVGKIGKKRSFEGSVFEKRADVSYKQTEFMILE